MADPQGTQPRIIDLPDIVETSGRDQSRKRKNLADVASPDQPPQPEPAQPSQNPDTNQVVKDQIRSDEETVHRPEGRPNPLSSLRDLSNMRSRKQRTRRESNIAPEVLRSW